MTAPIPGGLGPRPDGSFLADDPKRVVQNVERALNALFPHDERVKLVYHREQFYRWTGTHWTYLPMNTLRALVHDLFSRAVFVGSIGRGQNAQPAWQDFDINRAKLTEIVDGMQHMTLVDEQVEPPVWLDRQRAMDYPELPAREVIACGNYLVHAGSRRVFTHTPRLMNTFAVDYDYSFDAPPPSAWLQFLNELWPDDPQSIDVLQEIFGYLLTRRTDLQKMFMMIGPPRSGKGTIIKVLSLLLGGARNVTSISMADLNQNFGLEEIVDKTLAIMQDARFRSRDDGVAVERVLSITGEDPVTVNRKNKAILTVKLPVRFFLVSNELPRMADESNALRTRMVLLRLRRTVDETRRDPHLIDKLAAELPSILNWALDGLDRVATRRAFAKADTAEASLDLMTELSSPLTTFIEDCCVVDPNVMVPKRDLYNVFRAWCAETGSAVRDQPRFSQALYAATSGVDPYKPRIDGKQVHHYRGIAISDAGQELIKGNVDWPMA